MFISELTEYLGRNGDYLNNNLFTGQRKLQLQITQNKRERERERKRDIKSSIHSPDLIPQHIHVIQYSSLAKNV